MRFSGQVIRNRWLGAVVEFEVAGFGGRANGYDRGTSFKDSKRNGLLGMVRVVGMDKNDKRENSEYGGGRAVEED